MKAKLQQQSGTLPPLNARRCVEPWPEVRVSLASPNSRIEWVSSSSKRNSELFILPLISWRWVLIS